VDGALRDRVSRRWHNGSCLMLLKAELVAVIGYVCGLCFYVDYAPYVAPVAWTMLPLCCSMVVSMAWTML
jgi:hypothetical protein